MSIGEAMSSLSHMLTRIASGGDGVLPKLAPNLVSKTGNTSLLKIAAMLTQGASTADEFSTAFPKIMTSP